jgi:hypothetical protein
VSAQLWRHKPVVKQVIEYDGTNADAIVTWAGDRAYRDDVDRLVVRTPQGDLLPSIGDYVVRGIEAEFYPVPRSIFLGSYEPVGE